LVDEHYLYLFLGNPVNSTTRLSIFNVNFRFIVGIEQV